MERCHTGKYYKKIILENGRLIGIRVRVNTRRLSDRRILNKLGARTLLNQTQKDSHEDHNNKNMPNIWLRYAKDMICEYFLYLQLQNT